MILKTKNLKKQFLARLPDGPFSIILFYILNEFFRKLNIKNINCLTKIEKAYFSISYFFLIKDYLYKKTNYTKCTRI